MKCPRPNICWWAGDECVFILYRFLFVIALCTKIVNNILNIDVNVKIGGHETSVSCQLSVPGNRETWSKQ